MIELLEYITIIAPGAVSVIGIVISIITLGIKFNNWLKELRESDTAYKKQISQLIEQNKELTRVNKILTDHLKGIRGYCDVKNKKI